MIGDYADLSEALVTFKPGAQFTIAPKTFTDVLYFKIGARPLDSPVESDDRGWWMIEGEPRATRLDIVLIFDNQISLRLNFEDYILKVRRRRRKKTLICSVLQSERLHPTRSLVTIRPPSAGDDLNPERLKRPTFILGDDFLRRYCVTFNIYGAEPSIGFSQNAWDAWTVQNVAAFRAINFCCLLALLAVLIAC